VVLISFFQTIAQSIKSCLQASCYFLEQLLKNVELKIEVLKRHAVAQHVSPTWIVPGTQHQWSGMARPQTRAWLQHQQGGQVKKEQDQTEAGGPGTWEGCALWAAAPFGMSSWVPEAWEGKEEEQEHTQTACGPDQHCLSQTRCFWGVRHLCFIKM